MTSQRLKGGIVYMAAERKPGVDTLELLANLGNAAHALNEEAGIIPPSEQRRLSGNLMVIFMKEVLFWRLDNPSLELESGQAANTHFFTHSENYRGLIMCQALC